jgi:dipeptidyl aminopeptidase/acylaminoacyl peptidase
MILNGLAHRCTRRELVCLGLLVGATVAFESAPRSFAQGAPRPIRRHLQRQTYDPANPRGPYLGQKPPGVIPKVFAPGLISTGSAVEYSITFSPNGNEIYFSRYTPADDMDTIWVTRQVNGAWTAPAVAEFAGGSYDIEPFITPDGSRMYFSSIRQGGPDSFQIWSMDRRETGWTAPVRLGSPFSANSKMYPTAARNGNLYFTEDVSATRRLFLMARYADGGFETPNQVSATVNACNSMGHAFIAADESFLVFDAAPDEQNFYLQVSFKGKNNEWLSPARLNDDVNAAGTVTCPAISPDGKYLFFHRNSDIYWVDARVVYDLRPSELRGP